MKLISTGAIRRMTYPLLFRFWFKSGTRHSHAMEVDGLTLQVWPTVFHPKYFGSSTIFARFLETLDLRGKRFLDLGTGSGIIGLFAARAGAIVTAVDVNPEAIRCAASNAATAELEIAFETSDLFSGIPDEQFDIIAWNPPFFPKQPADLAEAAFYAGDDHERIRRFASEARRHLLPGGRIYIIFSVDGGLEELQSIFRIAGYVVKPVHSKRWGLAERMVTFEIRPKT